jgi:octaprenyl-diphosphate synthase
VSPTAIISAMGGSVPAAPFLDLIAPDLEAVEERLRSEIISEVRKVQALGGHVLSAGGKRLRPAMVSLAARAINPEPDVERVVLVGAAVELVHMATLVHDDVIDNTSTRRGLPTANAVYGNGVAVIAGDFLLARAMKVLAADGDLRLMRIVSEVTVEMSEGEVMEVLATGDPSISREHYELILLKKTAAFVQGCCRCGAVLGGATEEQETALGEFGRHVGLAFQVADDLLDYTGDPAATGKPVGSDLREGRATLPFLLGLERAQSEERDRLLSAFANPELDGAEMSCIVSLLERCGVFEDVRKAARTHVDRAAAALTLLPPTRARDCLQALMDYVVHRDR